MRKPRRGGTYRLQKPFGSAGLPARTKGTCVTHGMRCMCVAPPGLCRQPYAYPALPRWANLYRPSGAGAWGFHPPRGSESFLFSEQRCMFLWHYICSSPCRVTPVYRVNRTATCAPNGSRKPAAGACVRATPLPRISTSIPACHASSTTERTGFPIKDGTIGPGSRSTTTVPFFRTDWLANSAGVGFLIMAGSGSGCKSGG